MKTYILTNPMASKRNVTSKEVHPAAGKSDESRGVAKAEVIYLGTDVHLKRYVVCRKVDGATPQPAQRFTPDEFKLWAGKQMSLAKRVVCCYEAGPFGYVLQRQLEAMGIECLVVRPENWDEHGRNVKTDGRDALALVEGLARYINGNKKALAIVRVPTEQEEQRRALSRQREALVGKQRSLGAWGKSLALSQGMVLRGRHWWKPKAWKALRQTLPDWMVALMDKMQKVLLSMEEAIADSTRQIEAMAAPPTQRPKGLGALTQQIVNHEALDWNRFKNRRQVSSYTGLCPSEYSSGGKRRQGAINKHGNRRLRAVLVEAVWRIIRLQPGWIRLEKIKARLEGIEGQRASSKKKLMVKLARELAVDLWRWQTGRASLEELGLQPAA